MDKLKQATVATKNFVGRHKVAVAVAATSAVWIWMARNQASTFNAFLEEKGLTDEFITQIQ